MLGVPERWIVFGAVQSAAHMKDSLYSKFLMNWCTDWVFEGNSTGAYVCVSAYACVQGRVCSLNSYQI